MKKILLAILLLLCLGGILQSQIQPQFSSFENASAVLSDTAVFRLPYMTCYGVMITNFGSDTVYWGGSNLIKANGFPIPSGITVVIYPIKNANSIYLKSSSGVLNNTRWVYLKQ